MKSCCNIFQKLARISLWLTLLWMPMQLRAQPGFARFYAHLGHLDQIVDAKTGLPHDSLQAEWVQELRSMTWRIQGHDLHFGDDTLDIVVDAVIDTIYYQRRNGERWDTLICCISKPGIYVFAYNDCCGAFDVVDPIKHRKIQGQVQYRLSGERNISPQLGKGRNFLGTIGDAGMVIDPRHPKSIFPDCRSAVIPNVYEMRLLEIARCNSDSCEATICQFETGTDTLNDDFQFEIVREWMHFYYLPLRPEPLEIIYDVRKHQWEMH
jgi:hypothetical protein